jgi:hypothetical protein
MWEFLKGYRTLIAAGLTTLFGVLAAVDWVSFFSDPKAGMAIMGSGLLMGVMRLLTTTPAFQNVPKPLEIDKK